jgi:tRNA threonylcarbamoyladenosine biosynthesis protein TsaB
MRLLAMDTASNCCSAAIWSEGAIAAARHQAMTRGHAEAIMPMIQEVMKDTGYGFDDLDGLAVTVGPGSFTGLRTGLATARGLALATGLPLGGVGTLEIVAHEALPYPALSGGTQAADGPNCLVALETRRADLYVQLFSSDAAALDEPAALTPEAVAAMLPATPLVLAGNGVHRLAEWISGRGGKDVFANEATAPDARAVAKLVARRWSAGAPMPGLPPSPIYVHPPEATIPVGQGRLRP